MRKTACIAGVLAASAGLLATSAPAFADSADNNGANVGDGNNLSVLPIQACNDNVGAAIGVVVPIASPQTGDCTNAPVVDHPSA